MTTPTGRHVAVYVRVSTDEQAKDGVSLAMQEDRCRMYAKLHELDGDELTVYADDGVSGGTLDRPALDLLRSEVRRGTITHVVVLKLDRLTRSMAGLVELVPELAKHGVSLHGVNDKLDTDSPGGRLLLHILAAVSEWERDTIKERTRAGLAHIKEQGYSVGAPPYGWQSVEWDGPGALLMPDHRTYPHILDAHLMRSEGESLRTIAKRLTGRTHPEAARRMLSAPTMTQMESVSDITGRVLGYKRRA